MQRMSQFQIFAMSFREAVLALLPYMFLRSLWIVFYIFNQQVGILDMETADTLSRMFDLSFPPLLAMSLASHLALGFSYERVHATILTVLLFFKFSGFVRLGEQGLELSDKFVLPQAIAIPIFVCFMYILLNKYLRITVDPKGVLNRSLTRNVDATLPYIIIYIVAVLLVPKLHLITFSPFVEWVASLPMQLQAFSYTLFIHLFWITGIHGAAAFYTFFDTQFVSDIYVSNIPFTNFFDLFVVYGGSGSTWSLIFALLLFSKNSHGRAVAKISIPFAVMNINEILLFGLPVIYNPALAIPFVIVPLLNHILGFAFLSLIPVEIINEPISWVTPILMNSWLITGGDVIALFLQIALISLGVAIYRPFIRYFEDRSNEGMRDTLMRKLRLNSNVLSSSDVLLNEAQLKFDKKLDKVNTHMKRLIEGELVLFYQPQYNLKTGQLIGMEALLRLKTGDHFFGPSFLNDFNDAGLSLPIDRWVLDQLSFDLKDWKERGILTHKVSMNITVDALLDSDYITLFITHLKGLPVVVEVTESSYIKNQREAQKAINRLRKEGFSVAIDDFGSGYSSLSMLASLSADFVKLDRQFLENTSSESGQVLYRHISQALEEMHYTVIAEGVENDTEISLVLACNIDIAQGYFYHKALSKSDIEKLF
ncbi:EAL domain-containing protein [Grimontia sp. NTOU-MAR1]|uniref:EAL domain-containing protein n=1 Tax=Grimontia sp. NTOU-MAR1 TaxID=3111011 RepID=UPI002DB92CC3|nr:EAL domain-containing protein [Grimontia sp. NTOU-MAR1]WRW01082.1 EAL domain-containing protein [Grimontia sp. NTOU-MAR1]